MSDIKPYTDLTPRKRRRLVLRLVLRCSATAVLLVALYYLAPLDRHFNLSTALALVAALALFGVLLTWQIRSIIRSDYPRLRAIETVSFTVPVFLLLFAVTYFLIARNSTSSFGESLSRTDSLYFTVTVFSTVGFGDITPKTEPARVLTTVQMLADLALLGVIARVVLGAVQRGLVRHRDVEHSDTDREPPAAAPGE